MMMAAQNEEQCVASNGGQRDDKRSSCTIYKLNTFEL